MSPSHTNPFYQHYYHKRSCTESKSGSIWQLNSAMAQNHMTSSKQNPISLPRFCQRRAPLATPHRKLPWTPLPTSGPSLKISIVAHNNLRCRRQMLVEAKDLEQMITIPCFSFLLEREHGDGYLFDFSASAVSGEKSACLGIYSGALSLLRKMPWWLDFSLA